MGLNIDQLQHITKETTTPSTVPDISVPSKKNTEDLAWYHKDIQLFGNAFSTKDRERFYADLAVLLNAGLDIQSSLGLIQENYKKVKKKQICASIQQYIIEGASLSNAIKATNEFSDYEVYSIQIGEETGQMQEVLVQLSSFYEKNRKYKQLLTSALAYPSFVIGFALLVTFFLLKYLVPLFSDVYKKFDGELPAITQKIIYLSDWVGNYGGITFLLACGFFGIIYNLKEKVWMRSFGANFLLKMPILGEVFHLIYLSRLCQSMYLLLNAKVPLLRTVKLVEKMVGFYPIEKSLQEAEQKIFNGSSLHAALADYSFYPNAFIALLKVGEESSTVQTMFQKLAQQYSETAEQKTATIGSLLEPILIICLGVLVAVILVAMYMPLFQMTVGVG